MKIQTKVFTIIFTIILITGVTAIIIIAIVSRSMLETEVYNHLEDVAVSKVQNIKTLLNQEIKLVKSFATDQSIIQTITTKNITPAMERIKTLIKIYDDISQITILDKNGDILVSNNTNITMDSKIFAQAKEDIYIGDIHYSKITDTNIFSIASPILINNIFSGIVSINLKVTSGLYKITTEKTGLGKTGEIYLINQDGYMITPSRFLDYTFLKMQIMSSKNWLNLVNDHAIDIYKNYQGKMVIGTHRKIGNWYLLAEISTEEAFIPVDDLVQKMVFLLTLLLTLSGIMAVLIASSIIDPIIQLKRKIEEIEKGNWNYKIVINTKDEIGQLSIVFNRMITKIKNTQDQLQIHHNELEAQVADRTIELRKKINEIEQQKLGIQTLVCDLQTNQQRYENLVNSIDGIVWEADSTTFQFTFVSKQAEHLIGYSRENWLQPNFWMEHIHSDERNGILEHRAKAVLHIKNNISEYRLLAKNNLNIWVKDLVNVEVQNNQVIKLYGVMFDITENKRLEIALKNLSNKLEIRVKERTQELYKTNEQLQAEIIERKQIEEELTLYHDHLEELVKERTIKLNQINSQLQAEITERQQIQEALQDSDEKNRLLLNSAPEAIYGLDLQGKCTFCNPACVKLLGYANAGDLINKNMHNLIHHTNADGSHHPMTKCNIYESFIKGEGTHISDEILWRSDNTNFPAEYWSYPIFKNGKTIGSVVTFIDITERKQAEKQLQHSEARFRKMFEEGPIGMVISDPNLNITKANAAFCKMLGYTETELLQINIKDISHPDDMSTNLELIHKSNNREIQFYQMEKRYLRKDRRAICCNLAVSFFRNNVGKMDYFLTKIEDITKRKKTETALKKARDAADAANQAKSEFLANMSHEIRTPMNAVIGFSDILAAKITDKKQKSYLNSIQTAGKGLLNLINDILDLSKIEAGRLDIQYEPVDLLIIFAELQQIFTLKIAEKNLEFIINIDVELPTKLMLDEIRLRQVLLNLIGNAIKFTDSGYIKLSAKLNMTHQQLDLIITVEDSGVGIPADQQTIIFESFKQQDGQSTRKYGGTGLGLSISKGLVEMMNGKISVNSTFGKGSNFNVTLQKVKIAITTKSILENASFQQYTFENAKVLVVDDIESNRNLIKEYLSQVNLTVIEAKNGQEALLLVEQQRPDLILMDLRMPIMNGYDATTYLKSNLRTAKIPIIALTASVTMEEKVKSHHFDGFLPKPVNISDLLNKLFYYLKYNKNAELNIPALENEIPTTITIELKNSLLNEIIPFLTEINTAMEMDMISECAKNLIVLGKKHNISIFVRHGEQLLESAKTFNIADIQKVLKELSIIIESLIRDKDAGHD